MLLATDLYPSFIHYIASSSEDVLPRMNQEIMDYYNYYYNTIMDSYFGQKQS